MKDLNIEFNFKKDSKKAINYSQQRFGHRKSTTSQNKFKDTPLKHGYHLEDYNRRCVYLHYYDNEKLPFYVGTGTIQRAFVFSKKRHEDYIKKASNINLIKVVIVAIDLDESICIQMEKDLINKYKRIFEGGSLVNNEIGGRGGSRGKGSDNKLSKPIVRLTKTFKHYIDEFSNAQEANRMLGIDPSSILKCCNHKPKYNSAGGYCWMFKDEYEGIKI